MYKLKNDNGSFPDNKSCSLHFTFIFILLLVSIITQTNLRNNDFLTTSSRTNSPVVNNIGNAISNSSIQTSDNDIYDIILYTGQSSMLVSEREVTAKK